MTSSATANPAISVANFLFLFHNTFHPITVLFITAGDSTNVPPAKPDYPLSNLLTFSKKSQLESYFTPKFTIHYQILPILIEGSTLLASFFCNIYLNRTRELTNNIVSNDFEMLKAPNIFINLASSQDLSRVARQGRPSAQFQAYCSRCGNCRAKNDPKLFFAPLVRSKDYRKRNCRQRSGHWKLVTLTCLRGLL